MKAILVPGSTGNNVGYDKTVPTFPNFQLSQHFHVFSVSESLKNATRKKRDL